MSRQARFLDAIGVAGLKQSTGQCYWVHVQHFIQFIGQKYGTNQPSTLREEAVSAFLEHLYVDHRLSPKSRNQALAGLRFLYAKVIGSPLDEKTYQSMRAKQSKHARRTLISKLDLSRLLNQLKGPDRLFVQLMYAGAMRLSDVVQLRIKDLNFEQQQISIADCKHDHFRSVPFPASIHAAASRQVDSVRIIHSMDAEDNPNGVPLPDARRRKAPSDARRLGWYWLFPSGSISRDRRTSFVGRYHIDADHMRKKIRKAIDDSGIPRRITPHDIRRTAATRMHFEMGMPLVRLQAILGHNSLDQTRDYILEDEVAIDGTMSPLDGLPMIA